MRNSKENITIVVYSDALEDRDYLRSRLNAHRFSTVCFENENICFDNFRSIQPKMVIAKTDERQIAWRFIFALRSLGMSSPLVLASHSLKLNQFDDHQIKLPIYQVPIDHRDDQWVKKIDEIIKQKQNSNSIGKLPQFIGESLAIAGIRSILPNVAASKDPVLIVGEKGTGKELLARIIADMTQEDLSYVKMDCGAIKAERSVSNWLDDIVRKESHNKAVFILINEIHLMAKQAQADILSFLDQVALWSSDLDNREVPRIRIAATADDKIERLVEEGAFRKDLFYRINVIPISIPPLRARKTDISLLMDFFIINRCTQNNKCVMILSEKVRELMYMHDWPGNVDELKGYMDRIVTTGDESVVKLNSKIPGPNKKLHAYPFKFMGVDDLPKPFEIEKFLRKDNNLELKGISKKFVDRTEKKLLKRALNSTSWNRKKAARLLNISYKSMLNKMKAYDIF